MIDRCSSCQQRSVIVVCNWQICQHQLHYNLCKILQAYAQYIRTLGHRLLPQHNHDYIHVVLHRNIKEIVALESIFSTIVIIPSQPMIMYSIISFKGKDWISILKMSRTFTLYHIYYTKVSVIGWICVIVVAISALNVVITSSIKKEQ